MLSKQDLIELKVLAGAPGLDPSQSYECIARIITSRISDPVSLADTTEFVRKLLRALTIKHTRAEDAATRQVYWGILGAIAAVGDRVIEEAPDNE